MKNIILEDAAIFIKKNRAFICSSFFLLCLFVCTLSLNGCGFEISEQSDEESTTTTSESEESTEEETTTEEADSWEFTIAMAGDINLDEDWYTMEYYSEQENGIYDCIDEKLLDIMNAADIMWINNEFTFTNSDSALDGKYYTFKSDPSNVEILEQMGVDIVSLANNHACDYGTDSLLDTIDTLTDAGIDYVGAGSDYDEASEPVYYEIDGKTVALVAASCAEKTVLTPEAGEDSAGIIF